MLNEATPECPPVICHPQVVGAFLGNAALRDALLMRVQSRSRGPLPMPRLRNAASTGVGGRMVTAMRDGMDGDQRA